MRKVATLAAMVFALSLVPPVEAANECYTDVAAGRFCQEIPVTNPGSPPGLPGVPPQAGPYFGTYYLWVGANACAQSAVSNACRGVPVAPGSGVPTPTGGAIGAGVFGVLYEESNGVSGLQRHQFILGGLRQPDHTVLV